MTPYCLAGARYDLFLTRQTGGIVLTRKLEYPFCGSVWYCGPLFVISIEANFRNRNGQWFELVSVFSPN